MFYPTFLKEGATLGITALSAGVGKKLDDYLASINRLKKESYIIKESASVRVNNVRANSGEIRALEFNDLVVDSSVDMILCAVGGDFLVETLPYIHYENILENPKWIMGYSDPTSLLYSVTTLLDIATIYGLNGGSYDIDHHYVDINLEYLKGNLVCQESYDYYQSTQNFIDGNLIYDQKVEWISSQDICVSGRCIGGCIDALKDIFGTKYDGTKQFIDKYHEDGIIFYFDNFSMSAENFYRTLLQMKYAGYFEATKAVILGRVCFENSETGMTYEEALRMALGDIPYVYQADIGHVIPRMTLINGAMMNLKVKDGHGTISFDLR
ncbi:MAG: S66 peptidase family protein [Traorella sp.]